jgi:hypothetical protein
MPRWAGSGERGQGTVELALILTIVFMLSVGLLDVGRGIYQYNAVASAARYGARWGSVIGGQCGPLSSYGKSTSDWCDQLSSSSSSFYSQPGNIPLQPSNSSCPSGLNSTFTGFYNVSDYSGTSSTTIVGAIAKRFDSNNASKSFIVGAATPGFDLSQLKVCIQLPWNATYSHWSSAPGDTVTVNVYYPFTPVSSLIFGGSVTLTSSSTYNIE